VPNEVFFAGPDKNHTACLTLKRPPVGIGISSKAGDDKLNLPQVFLNRGLGCWLTSGIPQSHASATATPPGHQSASNASSNPKFVSASLVLANG